MGSFSHLLSWPHHRQGGPMDNIHSPFLLPTFRETHPCSHSQVPFPAPGLKILGDARIYFFPRENLSPITSSSPPRYTSAFPHRGRGGRRGEERQKKKERERKNEREEGGKEGGEEGERKEGKKAGGSGERREERKWKSRAFPAHRVTVFVTGHHKPQKLSKD